MVIVRSENGHIGEFEFPLTVKATDLTVASGKGAYIRSLGDVNVRRSSAQDTFSITTVPNTDGTNSAGITVLGAIEAAKVILSTGSETRGSILIQQNITATGEIVVNAKGQVASSSDGTGITVLEPQCD